MHPKLRFRTSHQKDIQTFFAFLKDAQFDRGRSFQKAILTKYPALKKLVSLQSFAAVDKSMVSEFVRKFYEKHDSLIKRNLEIHKRNWLLVQDRFYQLADELFPSTYWPKGKYIAYPTMWAMYPRFLKDKTFQIPYNHSKKKYVNVVIAHEMLHFIFYNYISKKMPECEEKDDGFFLWNISEIFNTVVQNSPRWLAVFQFKSIGYPEHKTIVTHINNTPYRHDTWDLNMLIDKIIEEVQNQKLGS